MDTNIDTYRNRFVELASAPEEGVRRDSEGTTIMPGDLIAIRRGVYSHSALYIKNGTVLHTRKLASGDRVRNDFQPLDEVTQCSKFIVKNYDEEAWRKNKARPRSFDEIIGAVTEIVGEEVNYRLISNNCEHNSTNWRFGGAGFSPQVDTLMNWILIIGGFGATALLTHHYLTNKRNKQNRKEPIKRIINKSIKRNYRARCPI